MLKAPRPTKQSPYVERKTLADSERLAFSIDETALMLGISHWVIREWITSRELKAVRVGKRRKYLVPRYEIERLLNIIRG